MTKPIQWTGFLLVDGQMIKQFSPQYSVKSGYWFGPGKYATATNVSTARRKASGRQRVWGTTRSGARSRRWGMPLKP